MREGWPSVEIAELADWISNRTGLAFPPERRSPAVRALQRALGSKGGGSVAGLRAKLAAAPSSLDELLAELTIGETYFFRHPGHFDLLRDELLPKMDPHPARPLRLWSAGCATGEEAYSLAVVVSESGKDATVLGTDLSNARLTVARRARYGDWSLRDVSQNTIQRYFRTDGDRFELAPRIRSAVEFRYLNLVEDRYPAMSTGIWGMDVIFCRNVLIYLDRESTRAVARKLIDSLSDDGWLITAASDPLLSDLADVEVQMTEAGMIYRRRRATTRPRGATPSPSLVAAGPPARSAPATPPLAPATGIPLEEVRERADPGASEAAEANPATDVDTLSAELVRIRELADRGQLAEAGVVCAAALDRFRNSAELLYLHGMLLLAGGQAREAVQAARRALYLDRGLVVAHLLMGDALQRLGDLSAARQSLRRVEKLLADVPPETELPAAEGEPAGRLLRMVETRLLLLHDKVP